MKCDFTGCKHEARWFARKLFGDRKVINTCDVHKPGSAMLPDKLKNLANRQWYDVRPIESAKA